MPTKMRVLQQHDAGAMHVSKADPGATSARQCHRPVSCLFSLQSDNCFKLIVRSFKISVTIYDTMRHLFFEIFLRVRKLDACNYTKKVKKACNHRCLISDQRGIKMKL